MFLGLVRRPNASGQWTARLPHGLRAGDYTFYAAAVGSNGALNNVVSAGETVVASPPPTVGILTATPATLATRRNFTLSLSNVSGSAQAVRFYEETNGVEGLQSGWGGDRLIGVARHADSAGDWTLVVNSGRRAATYTLYAVADDLETAGALVLHLHHADWVLDRTERSCRRWTVLRRRGGECCNEREEDLLFFPHVGRHVFDDRVEQARDLRKLRVTLAVNPRDLLGVRRNRRQRFANIRVVLRHDVIDELVRRPNGKVRHCRGRVAGDPVRDTADATS
jgi:hypothetical protein